MLKKLNNKFFLPKNLKIYFIFVKGVNILAIETPYLTKKYIKLPRFMQFYKIKNELKVFNENNFNNLLFLWLKKFSKPYKKQLILKGLGFKGIITNSILELKIGFSHFIKIFLVDPELKVSMNHNLLAVEGIEADRVGNFLAKIKKLKRIDNYKGKGFWYKNELRTLKEIKKL